MAFADLFPAEADSIKIDHCSPEALAALDYEKELLLKNRAVAKLLGDPALKDLTAAPVVPSPRPRFYRTTDKRRVTIRKDKLFSIWDASPDAKRWPTQNSNRMNTSNFTRHSTFCSRSRATAAPPRR